jgi:hypothetical protein
MSEATTDDKIEQLVRSVLEAVDVRLDAVRHEVAGFAADVEQRHHEVLATVASLDERLDALRRQADDVAALQQELDRLGARVAAMDHASSGAVQSPLIAPRRASMPEPFLQAPIDSPAEITGEIHIGQAEFDEISKPLVTPHITTQVPMVPDPNSHHHEPVAHMPLTVPPPVTATFVAHDDADADAREDHIDLDQLASLLNERLGHFSLPGTPD